MENYQKRLIDNVIQEDLSELPAILIEGAKAVGKTATCTKMVKTVFSLDNDVERQLLKANPSVILNSPKPVLIDEWQREPSVWSYVRHAVDDGLEDGSVLLTGSSIKVNSRIHSGAGRIIRLQMRPYTVEERQMSESYIRVSDMLKGDFTVSGMSSLTLTDYIDEIYKTGFPGMRQRSDRARQKLVKSYIQNIVEHEFTENGFDVQSPQSLYEWLRAYAAAVGTETKYQTIIDAAMANNIELPSRPTLNRYREALEILYITDEVQPFLPSGKVFQNLSKGTKHFMLDPAIVLALLEVDKEQLADYKAPNYVSRFNQTLLGQIIESLVYQSLVVYAEINEAKLFTFRDRRGIHEIDFIIQKGMTLILFEVKADNEAKDSYMKHLNWFEENIAEGMNVIKVLLNTGPYAYTRQQDQVHVIPISMLGC